MDYLLNAQKLILENTQNGHYAKAYKDAEYKYWDILYEWAISNKIDIKNCLDIGCAYGTWLTIIRQLYPNCKLHGIDFIDNYSIQNIVDKLDLTFEVCNIQTEEVPFNTKFDLIIITEVLEHFNLFCIPTLTKIVDKISDDGYLFLSTPDSNRWGKINFEHFNQLPLNATTYADEHVYQFNIEEIDEIANILKIKPILLSTNEFGHINGIFKKAVL